MSTIRWRFVNQRISDQVIIAHDARSAEVLSGLLMRLEPGQWSLQEESVLGNLLGAVAPPSTPALKMPPPLPPRPGMFPSPPPSPPVAGREKRRFQRFNMDFKVILICEGKTFRTYSSDVSVGGMSLKHKVPPFMLNNQCRVVVSRRDSLENIEFFCQIHGGIDNPRRVEFLDCDPITVTSFEHWIENGKLQARPGQKTA